MRATLFCAAVGLLFFLTACALGQPITDPGTIAGVNHLYETGQITAEQRDALLSGSGHAPWLDALLGAGAAVLSGWLGLKTPLGANIVASAVNRSTVPSRSAKAG